MQINNTQVLHKKIQLEKSDTIQKNTIENAEQEDKRFSVLQDDVVTLFSSGGGHPDRPKK
ncbi:MAG: hypothetical protein GY928_35455 [Colwellia sp.]|nr:hypothetical protein [Colwellia sp.]